MELWQGLVARLSLSSPDITKAMRALHRMVFVGTVPVAREFHPLSNKTHMASGRSGPLRPAMFASAIGTATFLT